MASPAGGEPSDKTAHDTAESVLGDGGDSPAAKSDKRGGPKKQRAKTSSPRKPRSTDITAKKNPAKSAESTKVDSTVGGSTPAAPSSRDYTLEEYQAHMRQWHNRIGKKYRSKLNEQFECLQAVLRIDRVDAPPSLEQAQQQQAVITPGGVSSGEGEEGGGHVSVRGRTMNKAKVLDMARERIEALTREREELMREREALLAGLREKRVTE